MPAERLAACFALIVLGLIVGCGGGADIGAVTGTVTMDGQPLEGASVVFVPAVGGRPAGAMTDAEGKFELNFSGGRKGTLPGKNKVMISTAADPSETEDGTPIPAKKETVPSKYNATTELEFTVELGKKNVADFALSSEGALPESDELVQA